MVSTRQTGPGPRREPGEGLGCGAGWGAELGEHLRQRPGPADPQDASGKQVDLVSASVVVVGVIAGLLLCLLVAVVLLMSRYHRRKAQQMTQK